RRLGRGRARGARRGRRGRRRLLGARGGGGGDEGEDDRGLLHLWAPWITAGIGSPRGRRPTLSRGPPIETVVLSLPAPFRFHRARMMEHVTGTLSALPFLLAAG